MKRPSQVGAGQARDARGNTIKYDDVVKVINGPNKGKKGAIRHIHRNVLFLYNQRDF